MYDQAFDNVIDPSADINGIPFQYSDNQSEDNAMDLIPEIIVVNSVGQVTANQNTFVESFPNRSLLVYCFRLCCNIIHNSQRIYTDYTLR